MTAVKFLKSVELHNAILVRFFMGQTSHLLRLPKLISETGELSGKYKMMKPQGSLFRSELNTKKK